MACVGAPDHRAPPLAAGGRIADSACSASAARRAHLLFRNDGDHFTSVGKELRIDDPRRTVGVVWFDVDQDGDLNGLYRNDGTRFVDIAAELGMDAAGRAATSGSNGPSVADFDNDGDLDLFVASYGPNFLYRNDGSLKFTEVAAQMGVGGGDRATPSNWGDYDNDGLVDLYVSSYIDKPVNERDHRYHNDGSRFTDAMPELFLKHGATHGVQWADFDRDGDLDLALANNNPNGGHSLYRNLLPPARAGRSLEVMVVDAQGRATKPGAEVRVYAAGTRKVLGTRIMDTAGGYCSQSVMPVHVGLPSDSRVDVEVTALGKAGRQVTRVVDVAPGRVPGRVLVVKVAAGGAK